MADRLDSRDLVEEYNDLGSELDALEDVPMYDDGTGSAAEHLNAIQRRQSMLAKLLKDLEENCEGDPADDGIQLIPKDDFVEFAKEWADGCGYMSYEMEKPAFGHGRTTVLIAEEWPFKYIDWQAAADELEEDWTEIEFDGVTYLCR